MSAASTSRFTVTNNSTQICGSCAQRRRGCMITPRSRSIDLLVRMFFPQLVGLFPELDGLGEQLVVAVPLHEVGPAHERAVLAGAAVVVPQVEEGEVDGLREGRACERAVLV